MSKTAVREGRETRKPISMRKSLEVLRKELMATAEPETIPNKQLATVVTLALPPLDLPTRAVERLMKNCPAPEFSRNAPNSTNRKMYVAEMPATWP